jgi:hypothetical protein
MIKMFPINESTRNMVRNAATALGETTPESVIVERFETAYNCKIKLHDELNIATMIEFHTKEDELLFILKWS